MKESIKKRIEAVRHGEVPEGYRRTKDIGIAPSDWKVGKLSDVLHNEARPVSKPDEPYWRLGIRSWAKGTFHACVEDPKTVDMDELYVVRENDLVVNITFAWEHAIAVASKEDDGLLVSHRFPTYVFDDGNVPAYYRAVVSQRFFKDMLDHISPGGAGRNRVLNRKDFLALPCYVPPVEEQKKIAEILATCDQVIELKQQLLEEKCRQKQWLMQKLLDPNSGVRLPGYAGKWKQLRLRDLGSFSKGSGISNDDCSSGDCPCVKYGDIYVAYGEYFTAAVSHTEEDIFGKAPTVSEGALLFTGSGEDPKEIGKCTVYLGNEPIAVGGDIIILKPKRTMANPLFLAYALNAYPAIKQKACLGQGYSIVHIYGEDIKKISVYVPPTIEEQERIAEIIKESNSAICLIEDEIAKWQQKKKALMQLLLTGLARVNA